MHFYPSLACSSLHKSPPRLSFVHLEDFSPRQKGKREIVEREADRMRTGGNLNAPPPTAAAATISETLSRPPPTTVHSPWHSPVPYLFGGLAAMLGLIAFALLILACSYWKISRHSDNRDGGDRDVEAGDGKPADISKALPVLEDKIVVIMAGDVRPTFLATPILSCRASTFGDGANGRSENQEKEKAEKPKQEMSNYQNQTTATTPIENGENDCETQESQEQNH